MNEFEDFHEIWWIYSDREEMWGGLRIAHFRKSADGTLLVIIASEPRDRMGLRIWQDVAAREGWRKVRQIAVPSAEEVRAALAHG